MRISRSITRFAAGALLAAGAAFAAPGPAAAQAAMPDSIKALIPAAKEEGALLVWGTTLNPRQTQQIEDAFNEYYGLDADLTHQGGPHEVKSHEVAEAFKNNVPTGIDLFWTALPKALMEADALVEVDWAKEFGLDPQYQMDKYGYGTHHSNSTLITVNTNLVKPEDYPRKYEDLLDPKWKGKIALPRSAAPWAIFSYAYGNDLAEKMVRTLLGPQEARMVGFYPAVIDRVIGGEFAIGLGTDAFAQEAKGAPITHAPLETFAVNQTGAFLLKESKHPALARLWVYWAVSDEGQKTLQEVRGYSLITTKGAPLHDYAQGKKVVDVPLKWRNEEQGPMIEHFEKLIKEVQG